MSGSDVYVVVDQSTYLPFTYVDATLTPVTGKVNGDFTIEISKNGVGNQATTGITISEVDDTNNAGEYVLTCSGSTSFVTEAGTYEVVVYDTATPTYRWRQTIRVGNANTFTGTTASFSAAASDGRVTDGSDPIEDATVTLVDGSGTRIVEVDTNALGLWGPVYLPSSVTGYVQADGYAQSTFTISVSGLVATGPGADVTVSTVTSVSTLKASELVAYARREAADRSGSKTDTVLLQVVNDAIQSVARKTNSSYYLSTYDIELEANYSTGTLTMTNDSKVVTLAGGTFPTNAASGFILQDGRVYDIATRDSTTQVTLRTEYIGTTGAKTDWTYGRSSYSLPENLYKVRRVHHGTSWPWGASPMSYEDFVEMQQEYQYTQKHAWAWAVGHGQIHLWPCPSEDEFVTISYYRRPAQITDLTQTADVDSIHLEFLRRMISYYVCMHYGETEGGITADKAFKYALDALVENTNNDRNGQTWAAPLSSGRRRSLTRSVQNVPGS